MKTLFLFIPVLLLSCSVMAKPELIVFGKGDSMRHDWPAAASETPAPSVEPSLPQVPHNFKPHRPEFHKFGKPGKHHQPGPKNQGHNMKHHKANPGKPSNHKPL